MAGQRPHRCEKRSCRSGALLLGLCCVSGAPLAHRVARLPGARLLSPSYSGLVPVPSRRYAQWWGNGSSPAVHAHYWYTESERDPVHDPLILWLQGGPGGSSLAGGFTEMGPLQLNEQSLGRYNQTGQITPLRNRFSWTRFAGLILLEYADIGFSTCDAPVTRGGRCRWDIGSGTASIVAFLVEFFRLFPERAGLPLWVAGESFAGNLVTTVASSLDQMEGVTLAGVLHGNGAIGDWQGSPDPMGRLDQNGPPLSTGDMGELDVPGHVEFWWRAGLTSTKMYRTVLSVCPNLGKARPSTACRDALAAMQRRVGDFQVLGRGAAWWNVYNIYDSCSDMPHLGSAERSSSWVCGGKEAARAYFNRKDVQAALHVGRTNSWTPDDDGIVWEHPRDGVSFIHEIKRVAKRYPFLAYSGDADAQIPHTSTEAWTSALGLEEIKPYQKWTVDNYVQGYCTLYEYNFTFATVKGAGHMVPLYRPAAAYAMVSRYIQSQSLLEPDP